MVYNLFVQISKQSPTSRILGITYVIFGFAVAVWALWVDGLLALGFFVWAVKIALEPGAEVFLNKDLQDNERAKQLVTFLDWLGLVIIIVAIFNLQLLHP